MSATPAWPPKSAPRLFIEPELAQGAPIGIEGSQAHYLISVMRVSLGDSVILCDDKSGEWAAEVTDISKRSLVLIPTRKLRDREQVPDLWLCVALIKKPRFDLILEKATELGVRRIIPIITRRSVVDKINPDRARAITVEAAEQCARTALPELADAMKLDTMLRNWSDTRTLYFADEEGGAPLLRAMANQHGSAGILIGPEGGFDEAERKAIRALPQSRPITLGPRILRAETAAISATSIWMAIGTA